MAKPHFFIIYKTITYRILLTIAASSALIAATQAQTIGGTVTGIVRSKSGDPLPGISIKIEGATSGSITNEEGKYTIEGINKGTYTLVATGVGYMRQQKEVTIMESQSVEADFVMVEDIQQLQTVEITGRKETTYKSDYSSSASKTQMEIKDIPQTVSSVTKELIQDRQALRLKDVVQNVAGVNEFSVYDDITMRGFRNSGNNGRLLNGLRTYNNFWTSPLLVNIERVEFIKGPASATFANANPGGTVNMITKKPLEENRQAINFTVGTFNTYRTQADFTGPLDAKKTLLYRLNVGYENAESFRDQIFHRSVVVAPSISFLPREGTRFNADLVYSNLNTILDRGRPIFQNDNRLNSTPINFNLTQPGDFLKQENLALTLSFSQQFTRDISFNASYLKFRFDEKLNEHGFNDYITRDSIEMYFTDRLIENNTDNLTAYFNFNFNTAGIQHSLLAGYDYISSFGTSYDRFAETEEQGVSNFSLSRPTYFIRPVSSYTFLPQNLSSYGDKYNTQGVYLQDVIKIKKLQLLLSLRQEFYKYPESNFQNTFGEGGATSDQKQDALLPRIGLTYAILPQLNVYGTYTTGFEPQDGFTLSNPQAGGPFEPLTSQLLETGLKGEFFNKRLFAGLAIYEIKQNNVLVSANDADNPDLLVQRGQERARGFELEAAGRILPNLSLSLNYAYNEAVITEDAEGDPNGLVGLTKENAPKHVSGSWIKYTIRKGVLSGLGLAAGHSQASVRETFDRTLRLPGYAVFNAAAYYQVQRFQLALNVGNITDKTYYSGGYNYQRNFPGTPRNFLLNVGYTF